jgi:hypothetical protein
MRGRACDPHAITLDASTATDVPIAVSVVLPGLRSKVTSRLAKLASQKMNVRSVKAKLASLRHSNSDDCNPRQMRPHTALLIRLAWLGDVTDHFEITVLVTLRTIDVRKLSV